MRKNASDFFRIQNDFFRNSDLTDFFRNSALQYASEELKGDREIVLAGLPRTRGSAEMYVRGVLQHASDELKNDPEFVAQACGSYAPSYSSSSSTGGWVG